MNRYYRLIAGIFLGYVSVCYAIVFEDLVQIQQSVSEFVTKHIQLNDNESLSVQVDKLAETTKLIRCKTLPRLSFPEGLAPEKSSVVSVECVETPGWRIYVPFQYQLLTPVVVAKHKMLSGDAINPADLAIKPMNNRYSFNRCFKSIEDVFGLSASRVILEGEAITNGNTRKMPLIKRNQSVTLQLKRGPVIISMVGVAKSDGYLNESVPIINPSSKKVIDAVTTGVGQAELVY